MVTLTDVLATATQVQGVVDRRGLDHHISQAYLAHLDRTVRQYTQGLPSTTEPKRETAP